jgi:hypothetical protein
MLIDFEDQLVQRKRLPKFFFLAVLLLLPIGGTMAANITISSGNSVEFGQGVQVLATCAPNVPVYLRPIESFVNASGAGGKHMFSGISLEGIQNSCIGYDFLIRAYGETGTAIPLFDVSKSDVRVYQSNSSTFSRSASDGFTISNQNFGQFTLTFDTPVSQSTAVYRLTLEVLPHDVNMIRYNIGDTGPGGGVVFLLPNSIGNNTGLYFEATTSHVSINAWCDTWPIDIPQAIGSGIGSGRSNTNAITSICGTGAAVSATQYNNVVAGDWFLPSSAELSSLFNSGISGFSSSQYWASDQIDPDDARIVSWPSGITGGMPKIAGLPVIPVRTFS